ncbi:DMT family transporter [Dactylosporangium siamense]|uniref:Membrane protein n=1 Tax=Dactylosporangium siamense TaxID=685454 RepID=A0A919PN61_9ACTN|nr:EamA family transporter [Dactylosporangium siamense]GIG46909.1 membrane protein [Dactylosporangium siamense]
MGHNHSLPVGRGLFFIAFAAASWGVGGFVAAVLYDHSGLGPIAVTFWRYLGGLLLLAAMRPLRKARLSKPTKTWMVVNGLGMALYQTAYYVAIDLAGVAVATVVVLGSGPVLVTLGARVFLGERLGRTGAATVAVSLAGLVLLTSDVNQDGGGGHPIEGLAVALVSAAGYAAVTLLNRAAKDDPYDSALGGFAVGTVVLLPLALMEGLLPTRGGIGVTAGLLAFLGAVPTALAYALFFAGLTVVRATTASVVALVEPLAAVALGVLVLHEPLTGWSAAGAGLLLSAVVTLSLTEGQGARRSRTTAVTAKAPAATAAASPHHQRREESAGAGGAALADGGGGDCAGRDSTTDVALTGLAPGPVTTTVHVPGERTGPEA